MHFDQCPEPPRSLLCYSKFNAWRRQAGAEQLAAIRVTVNSLATRCCMALMSLICRSGRSHTHFATIHVVLLSMCTHTRRLPFASEPSPPQHSPLATIAGGALGLCLLSLAQPLHTILPVTAGSGAASPLSTGSVGSLTISRPVSMSPVTKGLIRLDLGSDAPRPLSVRMQSDFGSKLVWCVFLC